MNQNPSYSNHPQQSSSSNNSGPSSSGNAALDDYHQQLANLEETKPTKPSSIYNDPVYAELKDQMTPLEYSKQLFFLSHQCRRRLAMVRDDPHVNEKSEAALKEIITFVPEDPDDRESYNPLSAKLAVIWNNPWVGEESIEGSTETEKGTSQELKGQEDNPTI